MVEQERKPISMILPVCPSVHSLAAIVENVTTVLHLSLSLSNFFVYSLYFAHSLPFQQYGMNTIMDQTLRTGIKSGEQDVYMDEVCERDGSEILV